MLLDKCDIKTKEVLEWKGIHLFHFSGSSCSQKLRIFLNIKDLNWVSHPIDLIKNENFSPWYLGINPRGLVPTLVHDGEVHIESNEIMKYLDIIDDSSKLYPTYNLDYIMSELYVEDDLHLDLRTLTFRFIVPHKLGKKERYLLDSKKEQKGTIKGKNDPNEDKEINFWINHHKNGITEDQVKVSVSRFQKIYEKLNKTLQKSEYLNGKSISILDIAWYVSTVRLISTGFPIKKYTYVYFWFKKLNKNKKFSKEVRSDIPLLVIKNIMRVINFIKRKRLVDIVDI